MDPFAEESRMVSELAGPSREATCRPERRPVSPDFHPKKKKENTRAKVKILQVQDHRVTGSAALLRKGLAVN